MAKFRQAETTCAEFSILLKQAALDVPEIQADRGEDIARDKARQAFEKCAQPVVVSDDSWIIPGLNGFPGPYMKYMNDWLKADDWLNLTRTLADRRVILRQCVAYYDATGPKIFNCDLEGVLLRQPRGTPEPYPHSTLVSFDGGKTSTAEHHQRDLSSTAHMPNVWHDFADWYCAQHQA